MTTPPDLLHDELGALADVRLRIPQQVVAELRRLARESGRTLEEALADAVESFLEEHPPIVAEAN